MAGKRKASGLVVYNLILKEVSRVNNTLSEAKKLSLRGRHEFIRKKIWPNYEGVPRYKIKLWELRELIDRKIKYVRKKKICDVREIPVSQYTNILYYIIDEQIANIYPDCIYIKITAGRFGNTTIFNTREYDYERTGLGQITRDIDKWVDENRRKSDDYPLYNGFIELRPKKKNNGLPENLYLHMILYIDDVPVQEGQPVRIIKRVRKSKTARIKEKKVKEYFNSRIRNVRLKKTKYKQVKAGFYSRHRKFKEAISDRSLISSMKTTKKIVLLHKFRSEKGKLKRYKTKKIITREQYEVLLNYLIRVYGQPKEK